MAEQVTISKEEYEKLIADAQNQTALFNLIESMQNEIRSMKEQMQSFSLHFGHMYASQSIEETLQAMGELGKYEIGADDCKIYSVDAFDKSKLFTVDESGKREYMSLGTGGLIKKAIETHEAIINDWSYKEYNTTYGSKNNALYVPLENQQGEVIGLVYAKGKDGGFTEEDIKAFDLKDGKIGNAFRMGLENKALQQKATTDPLTHLANREGMFGFIKTEALEHIKHDEPVSVILLDIDHFKKFNDTYGHDVGDECLKKVASVLQENIRQSADSGVFRWGGEEMLVIIPVDESKANDIANRLRKAIENSPIIVDGKEVPITVSGGVAEFQGKTGYEADKDNVIASFHSSFAKADTALYFSKEHGRNQICRSSVIESEIQNTVDLAKHIVAGDNKGYLWIAPDDKNTAVAYSDINKDDNPELVQALLSRAENCPDNAGKMRVFNAHTKDSGIVVNFVAYNGNDIHAELESKEQGDLVSVPLTENEQAAVKQEMIAFMERHDIEIPKALDSSKEEVSPEVSVKSEQKVDEMNIPEEELDDTFYEGTKDEVQAEINAMKAENEKLFSMPLGVELKSSDYSYESDMHDQRTEAIYTFKVGEVDGKDLLADMYAGRNLETGENIIYNMDGDMAYAADDRDTKFPIPSEVLADMEKLSTAHIEAAAVLDEVEAKRQHEDISPE